MSVRLTCQWSDVSGLVWLTLEAPGEVDDPLRMFLAYRKGHTTEDYIRHAMTLPAWESTRLAWFQKHNAYPSDIEVVGKVPDWDACETARTGRMTDYQLRRREMEQSDAEIAQKRREIQARELLEADRIWRAQQEHLARCERERQKLTARVLLGAESMGAAQPLREDNDRNRRAWGMYQAGATGKTIAETLGVSTARAYQLVHSYERRIVRATDAVWKPVNDEAAYGIWHTFTHEGRVTRVNPLTADASRETKH